MDCLIFFVQFRVTNKTFQNKSSSGYHVPQWFDPSVSCYLINGVVLPIGGVWFVAKVVVNKQHMTNNTKIIGIESQTSTVVELIEDMLPKTGYGDALPSTQLPNTTSYAPGSNKPAAQATVMIIVLVIIVSRINGGRSATIWIKEINHRPRPTTMTPPRIERLPK